MSLDACAVAGNTFASFSPSFSLPPPLPLSFLARGVFTSKLGFCNRFLNEVWTVIGLSPFTWFPFHPPPQTFLFPFFSFMSFCLHVSSSSSFLSLARTIVRTLVCTHTRTRTLLTARLRWPRFVTMRFGSSVVPLHLVPFHRQPHTPLSVSSFSFSSVPFACTCAHLLSGQDGGHTCLPSGRRVCVTLVVTGILLNGFSQQGDTAPDCRPCLTKLSGGISSLASWTYLRFSFLSEWH